MNMLHDSWWISTIDHRVSTALVFFLLLMTMGNGHKKPYFPLRILLSFIALCAVSEKLVGGLLDLLQRRLAK